MRAHTPADTARVRTGRRTGNGSRMSTSTLGFALLTLLARAPATGYELGQRLDRPVGYFWTAQHSQIHAELHRLSEAGLAGWEAAPGPGPREKKIYSITEAGRDALSDWVGQPPGAQPVRNEMLLKAYTMWAAEPDAARRLFAGRRETHLRRLADYQEIWDRITRAHEGGVPPRTHPDFGSYVTLRLGIDQERESATWCTWVLDLIGTGDDAGAPSDGEPETGPRAT